MKIAAGGIISVILATTLRGHSRELSAVFSIAACVVLAVSGLTMFRTVVSYLRGLQEMTGVKSALLKPVLNVCGIGLLSRLCASFCREAGEGTIASVITLCGNLAAICAGFPLMDAVQSIVRDFLR